MRLWHKDLITVLPRQQLLGQWRECCLIAKNIAEKGTPNHVLVNPVMDYPLGHLYAYAREIYREMKKRRYHPDWGCFVKWLPDTIGEIPYDLQSIFKEWHTGRYMMQCMKNLEEKYDRGAITDAEWELLVKKAEEHFMFY